jgi:hypothetical protein
MKDNNSFRLQFGIKHAPLFLNYRHTILALGSCFAQEMGQMLQNRHFNINLNPHGILFNPTSIKIALQDYISNKKYDERELIFHQNLWHSLNHSGKFSDTDKTNCLVSINEAINNTHQKLKTLDWLIVSFGSTSVYHHESEKQIVANCHKLPQQQFTKKLLKLETILAEWNTVITQLQVENKNLKIIFTVSPVRYVRDGVVENNISKSILIQAVHELVNSNNNCFYFPAYELVIDDLRDYRFYKDDFVHPNETAVNYVWQKFSEYVFDEETKKFETEMSAYNALLNHRPLKKQTGELHQTKIKTTKEMLTEKYKHITL